MWFRIILDGARDVYHDAPSEPGLGSDPYDRVSCGGLPAVLLLMKKVIEEQKSGAVPGEPHPDFTCVTVKINPLLCRGRADL